MVNCGVVGLHFAAVQLCSEDSIRPILRGLTFELSGRQRQDASARAVKMYSVPPTGRWWPAVGAPLERRVRPHMPVPKLRAQ